MPRLSISIKIILMNRKLRIYYKKKFKKKKVPATNFSIEAE